VLFYVLWIGQLLPLMRTGEKIEYSNSIFILDMVFVLPALMMSAVLLIKNNALGAIFAPILSFKAFTLLFSVGVGGAFSTPLSSGSCHGRDCLLSSSVGYLPGACCAEFLDASISAAKHFIKLKYFLIARIQRTFRTFRKRYRRKDHDY
jgi:hypothetical protein